MDSDFPVLPERNAGTQPGGSLSVSDHSRGARGNVSPAGTTPAVLAPVRGTTSFISGAFPLERKRTVMSMKRTLLSGLILAPLCLALPGTAVAAAGPAETLPLTTGWGSGHSASTQGSAAFAGIGGAGVLHHDSGVDKWGNAWNEHSGSLAGIGGAAVLHESQEASGGDVRPLWPAHDNRRAQGVAPVSAAHDVHAADLKRVNAIAPAKAAPVSQAEEAATGSADTAPVREIRETTPTRGDEDGYPTRHHRDGWSSYHAQAVSAGPEGASSAEVNSHAGRHHTWYSASALAAGPEGAISAGVAALAVPGAAGYRAWEVGAGPVGAFSHSTEAASGVHEPDLD